MDNNYWTICHCNTSAGSCSNSISLLTGGESISYNNKSLSRLKRSSILLYLNYIQQMTSSRCSILHVIEISNLYCLWNSDMFVREEQMSMWVFFVVMWWISLKPKYLLPSKSNIALLLLYNAKQFLLCFVFP